MKTWTPYVAIWSFFALIVIVLAAYRKMLSSQEDDSLHVTDGTKNLVAGQVAAAQKIEVVEKWGKLLTAIVVAIGLVMVAIYLYGVFQNGNDVLAWTQAPQCSSQIQADYGHGNHDDRGRNGLTADGEADHGYDVTINERIWLDEGCTCNEDGQAREQAANRIELRYTRDRAGRLRILR